MESLEREIDFNRFVMRFKKPNSGKVFFKNKNKKLIKPQEIINYCPQDALILQENLNKNIDFEFDNKKSQKLKKI